MLDEAGKDKERTEIVNRAQSMFSQGGVHQFSG